MSNTATILRRICLAAAVTATAVTLAACGTSAPKSAPASAPTPSSQAASTGTHNQQDVMFAQMMIPHHHQAITMSDTELAKGQNKQVKQLATTIKNAQGPEIKRMQGWLTTWNAPATSGGHMNHGTGMMSPEQMGQFNKASAKALDRMFLQMMIDHHQGAVAMARPEQQHGQNPQARQLADSIVTSQQAQIAQMKRMLTTS